MKTTKGNAAQIVWSYYQNDIKLNGNQNDHVY